MSIGDEVLAMENDHVTATKVINVSSLIMKGNIQLDISQNFLQHCFVIIVFLSVIAKW